MERFRDLREGDSPIYTDSFKKWFGDWENDPRNASKIVGDDGRPLVVYHGTLDYGFDTFDMHALNDRGGAWFSKGEGVPRYYIGQRIDDILDSEDEEEDGFDMTDEEWDSFLKDKYSISKGVYSVYLNIRDPFIVPSEFDQDDKVTEDMVKAIEDMNGHVDGLEFNEGESLWTCLQADRYRAIREEGFDGIIVNEKGEPTYCVFNPNQIKSIDNNGGFSTDSDNIYESED